MAGKAKGPEYIGGWTTCQARVCKNETTLTSRGKLGTRRVMVSGSRVDDKGRAFHLGCFPKGTEASDPTDTRMTGYLQAKYGDDVPAAIERTAPVLTAEEEERQSGVRAEAKARRDDERAKAKAKAKRAEASPKGK